MKDEFIVAVTLIAFYAFSASAFIDYIGRLTGIFYAVRIVTIGVEIGSFVELIGIVID